MHEYVTPAIILEREPQGEADARISVWARDFGKLRARAVSVRKIISKLSAHLQPGILSNVRLVEQRRLHIVDALKVRQLAVPLADLPQLGRLLEHAEPDEELWVALTAARWSWIEVLAVLGWDPRHASCVVCGRRPEAFFIGGQQFFCEICASNLPADGLIYIHHAAL